MGRHERAGGFRAMENSAALETVNRLSSTAPSSDPARQQPFSSSAFARLRRHKRGATMIEFALVMLPFFILMFGILEVGLVFWASFELENATDDVARIVRTGQAQSSNFDETRMKQEICSKVSLLSSCATKLRLDIRSFTNFAAMTAPDPLDGSGALKESFSYNLGGPQEVVLMTAFYEWPLINFMSTMSLSNLASGNRLLRSSAAFRNEPFPES
jgi:Flp pilus assembly protein TadG